MRILEKHVIKEFSKAFLASLFVFLFLFVIIDSFTHLDDFIKNKTDMSTIFKYYLALLPTIFVQTSPIACLLAMVYTMGRLNYNNELIAMRTGGLSIFKIIYPVIILGLVLSLSTFLVSEKVATATQQISDNIKTESIDKDSSSKEILKNLAIYGFKNRQFFINTFNIKNNELEGLTVLEHDSKQNVISKIFANKVSYKDGSWVTEQCFIYNFGEYNHLRDYRYLEHHKLDIEEKPQDFLRQSQKISYMNSKDLFDYITKLSTSGADTALKNLCIDLYQKLVSPFTCLIMIFIGLPCAMAIRRKAVGFSSIGISILVALLYYVLQAISIALGKNGVFPALASVLITPTIFISSSIYLLSTSL